LSNHFVNILAPIPTVNILPFGLLYLYVFHHTQYSTYTAYGVSFTTRHTMRFHSFPAGSILLFVTSVQVSSGVFASISAFTICNDSFILEIAFFSTIFFIFAKNDRFIPAILEFFTSKLDRSNKSRSKAIWLDAHYQIVS